MNYFLIIRGPLASGKSTISRKLCNLLNAEQISIDTILDEHNLAKDREEGYISQKNFKKANEIVVPIIKKLLDKGKVVIIDGNFYWKSQIDDLIEKLKKYRHFIFTLNASVEICIDRDVERGKTHGEEAVRVVHKKSTELIYGNVIDITQPLDKAIKQILSFLPQN
ncbi:AAA family ATPase [Candidatus Woesearchaeota archaeon]|nr:AAA family ATPase [Candidatus Woesearchaeota archaeon]